MSGGPYLYPQLWRGCVGAWSPSRDRSGSIRLNDFSITNNHGVLTNMDPGTDWVLSGSGRALDFDASNDFVNCGTGAHLDLLGEMSASAWINPTVINAVKQVVSRYTSGSNYPYLCEFGRTSGKVSFTWAGTTAVTSTPSIVANRWTHLAWVRSGASGAWTAKVYIDGIEAGSGTTATDPLSGSTTRIGSLSGTLHMFAGALDDVRLYSRPLTSSEIATLASRRGVSFTMMRRRRRYVASGGATFKAYWVRRQSTVIGGGLR